MKIYVYNQINLLKIVDQFILACYGWQMIYQNFALEKVKYLTCLKSLIIFS